MWRNHQALGHLVGDPGAKVLAHQVHQHVQPGRGTGRRQYLSLIDVQRVGLDHDVRITRGEAVDDISNGSSRVFRVNTPAAASTKTPEQMEHRRAPRSYACRSLRSNSGGGASSASRHPGMTMVSARSNSRKECDTCTVDSAGRPDRPTLGRTHGEVVPRHTQLRARQRKELDRAAKLEGAQSIVGNRSDDVAWDMA